MGLIWMNARSKGASHCERVGLIRWAPHGSSYMRLVLTRKVCTHTQTWSRKEPASNFKFENHLLELQNALLTAKCTYAENMQVFLPLKKCPPLCGLPRAWNSWRQRGKDRSSHGLQVDHQPNLLILGLVLKLQIQQLLSIVLRRLNLKVKNHLIGIKLNLF